MNDDILIVDDEEDIRLLTAGLLEDEGYTPRHAGNSQQALAAIGKRRPRLVLLDIWLQGSELDGIGILRAIRAMYDDLPVIMMSGHGTISTAVEALKLGAYDFIEKPFTSDRMVSAVHRAAETDRLRREVEELRLQRGDEASELTGHSSVINQLRTSIEKVAPSNSRVLITGPAGAGKSVVARMIHLNSPRRSGPYLTIQGTAVNPHRFDEQLFGVETASATGPAAIKIGVLERAHRGTLVLDEIADMSQETQGKLIQALQERTFFRVGGKTKVEVDVRVIATSAQDLGRAIKAGTFREDLYFRLAVVPLHLPTLSQRRTDIPELVTTLMAGLSKTLGKPARTFTDDALSALQAHSWPGNVRELSNLIERLLILGSDGGSVISADMLPSDIGSETPQALRLDRTSEVMTLPLREAREMFEREYLAEQIKRFDGNVSRTAEFVGMERSALHRKLRSLSVNSDGNSTPT